MTLNIVTPKAHKVLDVIKYTETERTFRVEFDGEINHGQFMELSIPKVGEAPISISGYGEGYLDFTIRAVGRVTDEIFNLKAGDTIYLRGPYGNGWPKDKFKGKHIVVIAGGTGVSPVKSLVNSFNDDKDFTKSVHLVMGYKNHQSILFRDELEKRKENEKFQCIYCLDTEDYDYFRKGMVTAFFDEIPFEEFGDDYECIIVGPPIMMRFAALGLQKKNVPDEKIWVSFERKMSCAVGKCGHCRIDETYVCLDGPVFNYTKAKNLLD
ncbi:MAG: anaerobic sulfite reductase subunit AsrB [Peptoniphilaceae bacterium]|nr:anaerobic sulfite reductase subunit AsrB [Peptoniphilaceae bacterium]MDY3738550.1 anaerobic sulfite reductase subunit AsrB [Peptoniphilaceae bacterium]